MHVGNSNARAESESVDHGLTAAYSMQSACSTAHAVSGLLTWTIT